MGSLTTWIRDLFRRRDTRTVIEETKTRDDDVPEKAPPQRPHHPHPRIYAVDCQASVVTALEERGYTVGQGTLGVPYRLPQSPARAGFPKLFRTGNLNGIEEQEVIIVDLVAAAARQPAQWNAVDVRHDTGYVTEWPSNAVVDPRPFLAWDAMGTVDQILNHGGVVIAFVGPRLFGSYAWADSYMTETSFSGADVYGILGRAVLGLNVSASSGREARIVNEEHPVSAVLARHRDAITFSHKLQPSYRALEHWTEIATNKYAEPVAGVVTPEAGGTIILLPELGDHQSAVVREIIEQVLPSVAPDLVPHLVKHEWLHEEPYLLPSVKEHLDSLTRLEAEYQSQRALLEVDLEKANAKAVPIQNLLVTADRELVIAVHAVLRDEIGFENVIDVDAEKRASTTDSEELREDLRVASTDPVLLIEVKGVAGGGKDEDILQVEKAVTLHSTELPKVSVRGLTILNNFRHRPPLDRDDAFLRPDLATILQQKALGLITTWDLYRLVMNRQAHGWPAKALQDVFFRSGRIEPVPAHYEEVGRVIEYFAKPRAVITRLATALAVGDRIAFDRPVLYYEEDVVSMQLHGADVASGSAGDEVGLISSLPKPDARRGVRIFRVRDVW